MVAPGQYIFTIFFSLWAQAENSQVLEEMELLADSKLPASAVTPSGKSSRETNNIYMFVLES